MSNTDSDVFRVGKAGPVYFLVVGPLVLGADFTGPWTFATPSLPEDFKKIPLEHPRSRVLASVPGTSQAAEAVLLAQIPQTARVNKKTVKAPEVAYQGEPKFEPIETTKVSRAVNTDKDIIKVGDLYYMCFQGVWFMVEESRPARGKSTGPVPKEIYEIPASSPSYNVTYVTVVEDDSDAVVLCDRGGVHRHDGRVGLRRVGHRLLLPAVRRLRRLLPVLLSVLSDLRLRRVVQPVDRRVRTRRCARTDRTAAPASARATTRAPARTRAARRRGDRTVHAATPAPTTRAPARRRRRVRARTSTAAGADRRAARRSVGDDARASRTTAPATRRA